MQRSLLTLANGFAENGWKTDLALVTAVGPYVQDVSSDVRLIDLQSSRVLTCLPKLTRYLRTETPNALISGMSHANTLAIWARIVARVETRVIVTEHTNRSGTGRTTLRARMVRALASGSYRCADRVVGCSEGVSDNVASMFRLRRENVATIYNPVDVDAVRRHATEPLDQPCAQGSGRLIVAVGRLEPEKDFGTLLSAMATLRGTIDVRLVILGDGKMRRFLERQAVELAIDDAVHFAGFQSNPYSWMKAADVFVLSSRNEGLPTVLIEALACGTAVVSTDCPSGPREILENGKWGRLVAPGNPYALADAIAATLRDPPANDLTKRARDFDVANAVGRYAALCAP